MNSNPAFSDLRPLPQQRFSVGSSAHWVQIRLLGDWGQAQYQRIHRHLRTWIKGSKIQVDRRNIEPSRPTTFLGEQVNNWGQIRMARR